MAGKKKELCTRYTSVKFINTCLSSPIHRRRWWRRRQHRNGVIIFNGHRHTAHTRHQSCNSGRQSGCRKKQTKWNETASPFTATALCKISWRIGAGPQRTMWFRFLIDVWQLQWSRNRFVIQIFPFNFYQKLSKTSSNKAQLPCAETLYLKQIDRYTLLCDSNICTLIIVRRVLNIICQFAYTCHLLLLYGISR